MKKIIAILCTGILCFSLIPGCKKSNAGPGTPANTDSTTASTTGNNFSDSIKNIVPQPIIDSLRSWGMTIYDGQQPPTLSGSYLVVTDSCVFDNSGYNEAGRLFDEYQYTFSAENLSKLTITLSAKAIDDPNGDTDAAVDSTATFLAGTGNSFTIFAQVKGAATTGYGTSTYTEINIVSGQIASDGIAHFQFAIYMQQKDDPSNQLIGVNTSRIFVDGDPDGLARQVTNATTSFSPGQRQIDPARIIGGTTGSVK